MSINAAKSAVKAGVAFLDDNASEYASLTDWRNKLDLSKLNIASGQSCVLGQLFGDYTTGIDRLGLTSTSARRKGFESDTYGDYGDSVTSDELNQAWKEALGNEIVGRVYVEGTSSHWAYKVLGVSQKTDGTRVVTYEHGKVKDGKFVVSSGSTSTWDESDFLASLKVYEPPTIKVGIALAEKNGHTTAFMVTEDTWTDVLKFWRLVDSSTHAKQSYWEDQGYTNFRQATKADDTELLGKLS